MPRRLRRFIDRKAAGASATDHSRSIRRRLRKLIDLYRISRYRPDRRGKEKVAEAQAVTEGKSAPQNKSTKAGGTRGASGSGGGNQGKSAPSGNSRAGRKIDKDPFPKVAWISTETGTRDPGYLEDRAANFLVEQNLLQINGDFSGFDDMVDHCCAEIRTYPGARDVAETIVRGWFEQALVETVIGVEQLRQRKHWSPRDIQTALSPEALTSAVMQRYHIAIAAKREVSRRLGKPSRAASRDRIAPRRPNESWSHEQNHRHEDRQNRVEQVPILSTRR